LKFPIKSTWFDFC